jgi:hypothetical protein
MHADMAAVSIHAPAGDEVGDDFVEALEIQLTDDDAGAGGGVVDAAAVARDVGLKGRVVLAQIVQQTGERRGAAGAEGTAERFRERRDSPQMFGEPLPVLLVGAFRRMGVVDYPVLPFTGPSTYAATGSIEYGTAPVARDAVWIDAPRGAGQRDIAPCREPCPQPESSQLYCR